MLAVSPAAGNGLTDQVQFSAHHTGGASGVTPAGQLPARETLTRQVDYGRSQVSTSLQLGANDRTGSGVFGGVVFVLFSHLAVIMRTQ